MNQKKTGYDEYVEDQLNMASKSFAKYPFGEKDGKQYLEDICAMSGWSDKKTILYFFSARLNWSTRQFHICQTPVHVFANNLENSWRNIWNQIFLLKFRQFCIIVFIVFLDNKWARNAFLLLLITKMPIDMGNIIVDWDSKS